MLVPARTRTLSTLDLNFLGTALVLAAIGCMLIYSATYFSDPGLGTLHKQITWIVIGFVLLVIFIVADCHVYFDVAPILYVIGLALLAYLVIFGRLTANMRGWIHIGGFQFQPSEFSKIFTSLMLAKFFDSNDRAYLNFQSFLRIG